MHLSKFFWACFDFYNKPKGNNYAKTVIYFIDSKFWQQKEEMAFQEIVKKMKKRNLLIKF